MSGTGEIRKLLGKYSARDPREILKELSEYRSRVGDDPKRPVPRLTLYTTDGFAFSGWLLDVRRTHEAEYVLVHAPEDANAGRADVLYLALSRVAALKVHDSEAVAPQLSSGEIGRAPGEAAPPRLELRRELNEISERLAKETGLDLRLEAHWSALPDAGAAPLNLRDVAQALEKAVRAIARDEVGRGALRTAGRILVRHEGAARLAVSRDEKTLVVTVDLERALPPSLARELEDQLSVVL